METTERTAKRFSEIVNATFTDQEMIEVVRLNSTPEYAGCCATHNYCDANELMLTAYAETHAITEDEVELDEAMDEMNAAWDLAKASGFTL